MINDFIAMWQLMQQPYFLHFLLPMWVSIIAGILIALRFQR